MGLKAASYFNSIFAILAFCPQNEETVKAATLPKKISEGDLDTNDFLNITRSHVGLLVEPIGRRLYLFWGGAPHWTPLSMMLTSGLGFKISAPSISGSLRQLLSKCALGRGLRMFLE